MRVDVPAGPDAGLPWHYGNPGAEARAIESTDVVVDLSNRDVVTVSGPDRLRWLHSLTSQVFEGVAPGRAVTAYVLSPNGHVEHVLYGVDDGEVFWAWTEPGRGQSLVAWLDSMRFMTKVEVAVRGDVAVVWRHGSVPHGLPVLARREGVDSLGGYEEFVPRETLTDAMASAVPVGIWAYEARRIEHGQPRIGVDTDDRTIPNELGVPSAAVALDKGCYRGQETVARVHNLGRPPRRLVRLLLDGSTSDLPAAGAEVRLADQPDGRSVGFVGGVARHHELGPVALALLKRSVPVDAVLLVDGLSATQDILVDPDAGVHFRPTVR